MDFVLSPKYKDFLRYSSATFEVLEGTTASGKTTTGIVKFLLKVAESNKTQHIISGQNLGVIEKNIITADLGILDIFGDSIEYNSHGKGPNNLSHLIYHTPNGDKTIFVLGYDNASRWKSALGGQYGCVYVDEVNTADMLYVRQVAMRCDYFMCTLNPDDPDKEIYKEYINRCRPLEQYIDDVPKELLEELDGPEMENWIWWYFTFDDNAGLTEEKKEKIKSTHAPGTADYRHYILGLRGKAEGVIFGMFNTKRDCITIDEAIEMCSKKGNADGEKFILFSSGLDTSYSVKSEDTLAMSFLGITNKGTCALLHENVLTNENKKDPFAPSDIAVKYEEFLEDCRHMFGFSRDTFIDNADEATITELRKYKSTVGSMYNFNPCYKNVKIIDRIRLQIGWIVTGKFKVVDTCKTYVKELGVYSWSDKTNKTEPEDGNDHMINSVQYAWIPYKNKIGNDHV